MSLRYSCGQNNIMFLLDARVETFADIICSLSFEESLFIALTLSKFYLCLLYFMLFTCYILVFVVFGSPLTFPMTTFTRVIFSRHYQGCWHFYSSIYLHNMTAHHFSVRNGLVYSYFLLLWYIICEVLCPSDKQEYMLYKTFEP